MGEQVLTDAYGRQLSYLRLSVTDRCNFRCYYCMPEEGMDFVSRKDLLSFDELLQLSALHCSLGVSKIRITGGEPFVRKDIIPFLKALKEIKGLDEITITSNGTLSGRHIAALQETGIRKINISLDSLDRQRFYHITRRDSFETVYAGIFQLIEAGFDLKLNCVLAAGKNTQDIIPFIELTKQHPLSVRFLEEMPFNGSSSFSTTNWNHKDIYDHIAARYPQIIPLENGAHATAVNYRIPGYQGSFGIIPSFSRTFCGTCNRIRLSATGDLRTCLYGAPATNLRDLLRQGATTEELKGEIIAAVSRRKKNGFEAEKAAGRQIKESMSTLGG